VGREDPAAISGDVAQSGFGNKPLKNSTAAGRRAPIRRWELGGRFVILGAALGLLVGLWEARLLYFVPSVKEFLVVDSTWIIWFLAPLVGVLLLESSARCWAGLPRPESHRALAGE